MRRSPLLRKWCAVPLVAVVLLCGADAARAQAKKSAANVEPSPEEKKGYTLPYFFTAAAALFVFLPLSWPALRRWELPFHEEE